MLLTLTQHVNGTDYPTLNANAAHIVRCVNAHEGLAAKLQRAVQLWDKGFGIPPNSDFANDCRALLATLNA